MRDLAKMGTWDHVDSDDLQYIGQKEPKQSQKISEKFGLDCSLPI